jgi:hypothetical protein
VKSRLRLLRASPRSVRGLLQVDDLVPRRGPDREPEHVVAGERLRLLQCNHVSSSERVFLRGTGRDRTDASRVCNPQRFHFATMPLPGCPFRSPGPDSALPGPTITHDSSAEGERIELPRPLSGTSPGSNRLSTPALRPSVDRPHSPDSVSAHIPLVAATQQHRAVNSLPVCLAPRTRGPAPCVSPKTEEAASLEAAYSHSRSADLGVRSFLSSRRVEREPGSVV